MTTPKHWFCLWLATKQKLKTREQLIKHGICTDDRCLLCSTNIETHDHLFFSCTFSSQVWTSLAQWLQIPVKLQLHKALWWFDKKSKVSRFRKQIYYSTIVAATYLYYISQEGWLWCPPVKTKMT